MNTSTSVTKGLEAPQPIFISEVAQIIPKSYQGDKGKALMDAEAYVKENAVFPDETTAREVRSVLQSRPKLLTQWEIAQIASLLPSTSSMAKALIPSLAERELDDDLLQDVLNELRPQDSNSGFY